MPSESYYDDLNDRLASESACMGEDEIAELEREAELGETRKALQEYAAAVKKYGKALVALGRACD